MIKSRSAIMLASVIAMTVAAWFTLPKNIPAADKDLSSKNKNNFHVVGYLPDYRVERINSEVGRLLTDVIFFSVIPEPHGKFISKELDSPKTVALLKKLRDDHKTQIHLCVGGWDRSQGFTEIAETASSRRMFAIGLADYCHQHQFAGADIDWEHPKDTNESTNYGKLLTEIARAFKLYGLRLTVAMAAWQTLPPEGIKAVEAIHLMSYDAEGKHSTFEQSKADVTKLLSAGVPSHKIRLGIPFYGRSIAKKDLSKDYSEIVDSVKSPDIDEVDGFYFNGPTTIRRKTRFAKESKLNGVMVWEIGQDATGDASLLKVIHDSIE